MGSEELDVAGHLLRVKNLTDEKKTTDDLSDGSLLAGIDDPGVPMTSGCET